MAVVTGHHLHSALAVWREACDWVEAKSPGVRRKRLKELVKIYEDEVLVRATSSMPQCTITVARDFVKKARKMLERARKKGLYRQAIDAARLHAQWSAAIADGLTVRLDLPGAEIIKELP